MRFIFNYLFLIVLLFFGFAKADIDASTDVGLKNQKKGQDRHCYQSDIRYYENEKINISKVRFCTNDTKDVLLSKECNDESCLAFKSEQHFSRNDLKMNVGNPGFQFCEKLHGKARIVEFRVKRDWYKLDQCVFPDGSFVNTDYLMGHYLQD